METLDAFFPGPFQMKKQRLPRGQALVELLLLVPVLLLLTAGLLQITRALQDRIFIEETFRDTLRRNAAGTLLEKDLEAYLEKRLRGKIVPGSLRMSAGGSASGIKNTFSIAAEWIPEEARGLLGKITDLILDYDGSEWTLSVVYKPPLLFGRLFSSGWTWQLRGAVLRHPILNSLSENRP